MLRRLQYERQKLRCVQQGRTSAPGPRGFAGAQREWSEGKQEPTPLPQAAPVAGPASVAPYRPALGFFFVAEITSDSSAAHFMVADWPVLVDARSARVVRKCEYVQGGALRTVLAWRACASRMRVQRKRAFCLLRGLRRKRGAEMLQGWSWWAGKEARQRRTTYRCGNKWRTQSICKAMARWREHAEEEKQMKAKALKVVQRLVNRAFVEGFERWREHAVEEKQMKAKALRVVQRLMRLVLAKGFDQLLAYYDYRVAMKVLLMRLEPVRERQARLIVANLFGRWKGRMRYERLCRRAHKSLVVSYLAKFVLGLEAQRINNKRQGNAVAYAMVCSQQKHWEAWFTWFKLHHQHRTKATVAYERVHSKRLKNYLHWAWDNWRHHDDDYVSPILRRYERLARRRLTKAAADMMPDLLNAQMHKALARIFKGPKEPSQTQMKEHALSNAFDVWAKRKATLDVPKDVKAAFGLFMLG